jgi:hypothetical protein
MWDEIRVSSSPPTVSPSELRTNTEGARLNAAICPHNPDLVKYYLLVKYANK